MKRATGLRGAFFINGDISIHALVKRATKRVCRAVQVVDISIHALVKRATYEMQRNVTTEGNFNPRPREEGDTAITKA